MMLFVVKLLLSFLTTYFWGRILYCSFCSPKYKNNIISRFHSYFLGLGITSIFFWFYTIATNGYNSNYHTVEICLVIIIYFCFSIKKKKSLSSQYYIQSVHDSPNKNVEVFLSHNDNSGNKVALINKDLTKNNKSTIDYIAIIIIVLITVLMVFKCLKYPIGDWDGIWMWNTKARFLACGNGLWTGMFNDIFTILFHHEYPLLLSCSIARFYNFTGNIDTFTPFLLSCFFSVSCLVLPYLYLKKLKNIYYAVFALCITFLSPNILFEGSRQGADIPLAVFSLISLYEIIIWDKTKNRLPFLCVLFSSLCFWTKNEGIPWFIMYLFFIIYYLYKKDNKLKCFFKKFFKVMIISLPVIISVLSIRYLAKNENDIIDGSLGRLKNILDFERHKLIFSFIWLYIKQHFWIIAIPIFILLGFIDKKYDKYKSFLILILGMYICYIFVYLTTPYDLNWHLITSFSRIITVFLPHLIFLGCLLFDYKRY